MMNLIAPHVTAANLLVQEDTPEVHKFRIASIPS